ncbi:hypothetical protein [Lactobacillus crispatus]|uniref:hypothetical protein n=1 Tax=Lactobacillus crispatus TaxID=47770 RepID=UPI001475F5A2|nr:hypothetical protein [Lactobacillus crispatus]MBE5059055.1 hypothetical protein [Lactobacillus crispatus]NME26858.1 hypothetical protein [Lactobacillus crispatus]
MNAITRSLTSFTRNHIRRQRAKELDALKLENKQIKQQAKAVQVVNRSLDYCSKLPADNPHCITSDELELASNFLFNYIVLLDKKSKKVENRINQLLESVKR